MTKWGVVAGCVLVGALALYLTLFRTSDEDRVRAVLQRFTAACAIKADDNALARAGRLRSTFAETTTADVRVDVDEPRLALAGRDALVEAGTRAPAVYGQASIELGAVRVRVDEGKVMATADALALLRGPDRSEKREVHFLLRNDGGWRIATVAVAGVPHE